MQRSVDRWSSVVSAIQANRIYFESNSDALQADEQEKFPLLIQQLRRLESIAGDVGIKDFKILITGFADPTGSTKANFEVSKARANLIREILTENGLNTQLFVAWGAGNIDTWNLPAHEQRIATLQILHPKLSNYRQ